MPAVHSFTLVRGQEESFHLSNDFFFEPQEKLPCIDKATRIVEKPVNCFSKQSSVT